MIDSLSYHEGWIENEFSTLTFPNKILFPIICVSFFLSLNPVFLPELYYIISIMKKIDLWSILLLKFPFTIQFFIRLILLPFFFLLPICLSTYVTSFLVHHFLSKDPLFFMWLIQHFPLTLYLILPKSNFLQSKFEFSQWRPHFLFIFLLNLPLFFIAILIVSQQFYCFEHTNLTKHKLLSILYLFFRQIFWPHHCLTMIVIFFVNSQFLCLVFLLFLHINLFVIPIPYLLVQKHSLIINNFSLILLDHQVPNLRELPNLFQVKIFPLVPSKQ